MRLDDSVLRKPNKSPNKLKHEKPYTNSNYLVNLFLKKFNIVEVEKRAEYSILF